jgi:predicted PhzF superfamily epimerase YddE/YHI9
MMLPPRLAPRPVQAWGGMFYAARFETPEEVKALKPDQKALKELGVPGEGWDRGNFGCFAAGGDGVDVTSRFFAPGSGIDEDPATGSWHTMLARVMSERFGRTGLKCHQAYPGRGAFIDTKLERRPGETHRHVGDRHRRQLHASRCCYFAPQGAGGASTGWAVSNSMRKKRPGRSSS